MAKPIGEEDWLAYLDEAVRNAQDLEQRVNAVENYKRAVSSEPGSLRIWLAYCNYFWSLWADSQSPEAGWPDEEQMMGRELFSFGTALDLWQQGYESIKYRLNDSHLLFDRWVSLEMELLSKSRTPEGVKRITHLYWNRLQTPHITWEETSQMFSSFLSEYNRATWEDSMKDVTMRAQKVKRLIAARDPYELRLKQAERTGDIEAQKAILAEYLEWEMLQSRRSNDSPEIGVDLCRGLYDRALTGILARDETTWINCVVFLSSASTLQSVEQLLDVLRRAIEHCAWSGALWSRYILTAEEAGLPFGKIESIKHAATNEDQLLKDGMEGMIEMYSAWCGFLKRNAMDAVTNDEAVDVADVGLGAALEDVSVIGQRLVGKDFQGDPKFRLERIYIQYLTDKKGAVEEARAQWNKLASVQMYADNHDFWFRFYMWEMQVFWANLPGNRSPTPSSNVAGFRVPTLATAVLARAVSRKTIDWPEKVLEMYIQHCNDYETTSSIRMATDRVQKVAKEVRKRRERENEEKAAAYAAYYNMQPTEESAPETQSPNSSKRKRECQLDVNGDPENTTKRQKSVVDGTEPGKSNSSQAPKRDRENSTILVTNLPGDVTQTKVRQYFKEYGHINHITALVRDKDSDSSTALIEFGSTEEAQSALLRHGKYFGQFQLSVELGYDLTVYVANYPPAANDKFIRDLFQDCGEILSIRWPSLKVNTHRRFCYVSFRDREASARAVAKEGTLLENKYKLVAKYSAPSQKKARQGALAEGREIHITNLDRSTSEADIKDVFSKFGNVTRVNVPVTLAGKNRGFAFLDFETKEQAQKAAEEMNNTKLHSQILTVELSKESKVKLTAKIVNRDSASPAPISRDTEGDDAMQDAKSEQQSGPTAAEISARTIALMGLPDTVNDARVQSLVEPLGHVVKLILMPVHGGALIEFGDAAVTGKAALHLDGLEFEGHKLRTGTPDELRQAKAIHQEDRIVYGSSSGSSASKSQKPKDLGSASTLGSSSKPAGFMPPPMTIRRPVLGKSGPKRGLGFAPRPAAASQPVESTGGGVPVKKSNADFKALFLNSGKAKTDATSNENGPDKETK